MSADYLQQTGVFLAAAVVAVPICARLGLGSVLGYLLAGVAVGPFLLNLAGNTEEIMRIAEFGVVVMLFLVGLEVQPKELWRLKVPVFGLGGLQVIVTAGLLMLSCMLLGVDWRGALAIGLALSLSSTAIVLQSYAERGIQQTEGGQNGFAVLLSQDIMVIIILAVIPMLAVADPSSASAAEEQAGDISQLPGWAQTLISLSVISGVIIGAKFLLRPIFRFVASTGVRELFTATALLIVVGIAVLMGFIGISAALGTFIGGVVLADSEYRHELESDLEPFKGLLLGLFFITVGAAIDFNIIANQPIAIVLMTIGLLVIKAGALYVLAALFGVSKPHRWTLGLSLAQGGEFAFVLISLILSHSVLPTETARMVTVIIALSMAFTPLLFILNDRVIQPRFSGADDQREADDPSGGHGKPVVIAGFGRYGQLAGRMLKANGFNCSILDLDAGAINTLRKHGLEVYYGDAGRHDLLLSAGCSEAKALIIAIDNADRALEIADLARRNFPHLKIIARAQDPRHAFALRQVGVDETVCEAEQGGIGLGEKTLEQLGWGAWRAARASRRFKQHQQETYRQLAESWGDDQATLLVHRSRVQDLEQMLEADDEDRALQVDAAWRTGLVAETLKGSDSQAAAKGYELAACGGELASQTH